MISSEYVGFKLTKDRIHNEKKAYLKRRLFKFYIYTLKSLN
jgi:hypothetical protein